MRTRLRAYWQKKALRLSVIGVLGLFALFALWTGTGHAVQFPQFTICGVSGFCANVDGNGNLMTSGGGGGGGSVTITSPLPLPVTGSVTQGTIPWLISGQGTAGTPDTGVQTIQGITSGFPVPVSGSLTISGGVTIASPNPLPVSLPTASTLPVSLATTIPVNVTTCSPCAAPMTAGTSMPTTGPAGIVGYTSDGAVYRENAGLTVAGGTPPPNLNIQFVQNPVPAIVATALPTHSAGAGAADVVCTAACTGYAASVSNSNAASVFCNLYNVAAASVTPGTTAFAVSVIAQAGTTTPFYLPPTTGLRFSTAASVSCTTTFNGATPVGAGTVNFSAAKL